MIMRSQFQLFYSFFLKRKHVHNTIFRQVITVVSVSMFKILLIMVYEKLLYKNYRCH